MDESRFGLLSIQRRCLTARGVKPLVSYQHRFKNFYLFGAYSPVNGDHFTLEFPYCNGPCFEQYLEAFSTHQPDEFKILLLDNGAFHKAKQLVIPNNIVLLFLPPYCPDHNKIERTWQDLHANVTRNHRCGDMHELMRQVVAYLAARNRRKRAGLQTLATAA